MRSVVDIQAVDKECKEQDKVRFNIYSFERIRATGSKSFAWWFNYSN